MKASRIISTVCAMGLSAACVMGVAGCSSNNQNSGSGAVAATINGTEIYEDTVTDYIQSVREQQGLTDEDSWGNYLAQMGTDPAVAWNGPTPPGHAAFADRAASGYAGPEGAACSIEAICLLTSHAR